MKRILKFGGDIILVWEKLLWISTYKSAIIQIYANYLAHLL